MSTPQIIGIVIVAIPVLLLIWAIAIYNRLVTLRNRAENAWAQIDVQLKRRRDLIPNLVETVKGYAEHEQTTLQAVIEARNSAAQAKSVGEHARAEQQLGRALANVVALAEQYPDLKANENFLALQEELSSTENRIGFARQAYNDAVMAFNTAQEVFPNNIIAGFFRFERKEMFELDDEAAREVPAVAF